MILNKKFNQREYHFQNRVVWNANINGGRSSFFVIPIKDFKSLNKEMKKAKKQNKLMSYCENVFQQRKYIEKIKIPYSKLKEFHRKDKASWKRDIETFREYALADIILITFARLQNKKIKKEKNDIECYVKYKEFYCDYFDKFN